MNSSQASCLLCLSKNRKTINLYSDAGKELNIISILSSHFWFNLDEINALPNICYECLNKIEAFHEFYESVQIAHKKFETVYVKIENDLDLEEHVETCKSEQVSPDKIKIEKDLDIEDYKETYQPVQEVTNGKIETTNIQDDEDDESSNTSVWEISNINTIDTARAFDTLPKSTQATYLKSYQKFVAWKSNENISDDECFSEAVMLEYFYSLQPKNKPTTLSAHFSMLRILIQRNHNIDITYPEVTSFLKKSLVGFQSQKNVFQPDEIQRFLSEAKDSEFLAVKVIMIFLINGVTRAHDLVKVGVKDVVEHGTVFLVKVPDAKTNGFRSFTLENEYAACVRKYKRMRPEYVKHDRFFLKWHKGKSTTQPIGKLRFKNAPKVIANFLKLKDAESYTCYSFCKDSVTKNKKKNEQSTPTSAADSSTSVIPSTATTNNTSKDARSLDTIPEKSLQKYLYSYDKFMTWKADKNIDKESFSERVMLDYFDYMKPKLKPTSLWAEYSKLKATIQKNHNVDISYPEVKTFLKMSSFAYLPRQCEVFRPDEIKRFLCEARDYSFLAAKVIMIFAIHGINKATDLLKLDVKDVCSQGTVFLIKIPDTNGFRSITVQNNEYVAYVQKYKELRPENMSHSRFFINYQKGKCTAHPIGLNNLTRTPKAIATFLNLKNAENYKLLSFHKRSVKRGTLLSSLLVNDTEECTPNKKKTSDVNSKQMEGSTEDITKSTITTSVAIVPTNPTTSKNVSEDDDAPAKDALPKKSMKKYVRTYDSFIAWKTDENIQENCFSEEVMLQYFKHLQPLYKPTSLWAEYSKLKTTIQKNHNVDISYLELRSFLRSVSSGYQPQKSNIFQPDDIRRFLCKADDKKYLVNKVVMILAIYGATNIDEFRKIEVKDVIEKGSEICIKIPDTKTNKIRSCIVEKEYAPYLRKYKELRPEDISYSGFFIDYHDGKCTAQPIGRQRVLGTPKVVAKFLKLKDVENYTFKGFTKNIWKPGKKESTLFNDPYTSFTSQLV